MVVVGALPTTATAAAAVAAIGGAGSGVLLRGTAPDELEDDVSANGVGEEDYLRLDCTPALAVGVRGSEIVIADPLDQRLYTLLR